MRKKNKNRQRRTPREWDVLFAEQLDSGLTQLAFCRSRGLSAGSFYNAKGRARAAMSEVGHCREDEFVAVTLSPQPSLPSGVRRDYASDASWDVELTLGGGVVLRVRTA